MRGRGAGGQPLRAVDPGRRGSRGSVVTTRSARSLLDVDTPSDLTVLQSCGECIGSLEVGELSAAGAVQAGESWTSRSGWHRRVFEVMTRKRRGVDDRRAA